MGRHKKDDLEPRTAICIRVKGSVMRVLQEKADQKGSTVSGVATKLLETFVLSWAQGYRFVKPSTDIDSNNNRNVDAIAINNDASEPIAINTKGTFLEKMGSTSALSNAIRTPVHKRIFEETLEDDLVDAPEAQEEAPDYDPDDPNTWPE